jgi:predicted nucleic acid-binding protein
MIILDTNIISELMHVAPDANVVRWMDRQSEASVWVSSITVFEVTFGIEILTLGRKQSALRDSFQALRQELGERIALFDESAADRAAELMASRQRLGRSRDLRDTMIAGIVLARHASLATRNVTHFADIGATIINPWVA